MTLHPEIAELVQTLSSVIIMLLIGIVGWFVRSKIVKIDAVTQDVNEIKFNYLTRFDEVKTLVSSENTQTRQKIADLHIDLARNYVRKDECTHCIPSLRTGMGSYEHDH